MKQRTLTDWVSVLRFEFEEVFNSHKFGNTVFHRFP